MPITCFVAAVDGSPVSLHARSWRGSPEVSRPKSSDARPALQARQGSIVARRRRGPESRRFGDRATGPPMKRKGGPAHSAGHRPRAGQVSGECALASSGPGRALLPRPDVVQVQRTAVGTRVWQPCKTAGQHHSASLYPGLGGDCRRGQLPVEFGATPGSNLQRLPLSVDDLRLRSVLRLTSVQPS